MTERHPHDTPESGITLLEATITAALLAMLIGAMVQIMVSSSKAQRVAEMQSRATAKCHALLDDARHDITQSVTLFREDAIGAKYRDVLHHQFDPPIANIAFPTPLEDGVFDLEDASRERTGNALLVARNEWTDWLKATSGKVYSVDIYKLVCWYPTRDRTSGGLTLRRWVSEPVADGEQIDGITDPDDRLEMLQHLRAIAVDIGAALEPVEVVWNVGGDPDVVGTFRHIALDGSLSTAPRTGDGWELRTDALKSSVTYLKGPDEGIATNDTPAHFGACRFGRRDDSGDGFPHGFEVQVIGPPSARRVMTHLTLILDRRDTVPVGADQTLVSFFSEI